jgi:glyoxylase-like metal-dependent hydrolase (beta-lactamase superfamily II)|tara:strand:+ start:1406 stop:2065 length:660 start_codon:yes stop_codon:yes gene_type:complete
MISIEKFTFNPFQENTYILHDETKECIVIDPGCYSTEEKAIMLKFISDNGLKPVKLLNTHCHVDHIQGNHIIAKTFNLQLEANEKEIPILEGSPAWGLQYGIKGDISPEITVFLNEGDIVNFGNSKLDIIFAPGHSPGHLVFISHEQKFVINGDVLFQGGFGRFDLPFGDAYILSRSIHEKMFTLPDDYVVYAGHMGETTIGIEKKTNPILQYPTSKPQ